MSKIDKKNVGRIAERIVANELEFRGYTVSDLKKEWTAKNADLVAAKNGKVRQIQVKDILNGVKGRMARYGGASSTAPAAKTLTLGTRYLVIDSSYSPVSIWARCSLSL